MANTTINFARLGLSNIDLSSYLENAHNITKIDLSNNNLTHIPQEIGLFKNLEEFVCTNNQISNLPKEIELCHNLKDINLSGNRFDQIPSSLLELNSLTRVFMGVNRLTSIPTDIQRLNNLETLFLAGNQIVEVPTSMCLLQNLSVLNLSNNRIAYLPNCLHNLKNLKTLSIHKNELRHLPASLVTLANLEELSLRNNPLVNDFVRNTYSPASLKEIAARAVHEQLMNRSQQASINLASASNNDHNHNYNDNFINMIESLTNELPADLIDYLKTARRCLNPNCKGVYFDAHVDRLSFVDFCGSYRVPLLYYLCKPHEHTQQHGEESNNGTELLTVEEQTRLRKVLLSVPLSD